MIDRLDLIVKQYQSIQEKLISGNLEVKEMTSLLKESSSIQETVEVYENYKSKTAELKDLIDMIEEEKDKDLIEMATLEKESLEEQIEKLEERLKVLLLPKDPDDDKNVIMEIKGAAGGDEGNIFAGDLFRMYSRYAESRGWKIQVLNTMPGAMGGYASIEFLISGDHIFSFLKHEAGVHRVQRVPETESQGRVHTSTATVLVMPEAEEIELDLSWSDVRFDTFNASGPGGQHVNTAKSAVRLTHIPTGIIAQCQDGKSQHENREQAYKILKARIYDAMINEQLEKEGAQRKSLIGTGDRSEKIRTYNYPQNRITDHRIGLTIQRLDAVIDGKLDLVIDELINEFQKRQLSGEL